MTLSVQNRVFAIVDEQVARESTASFIRLHGVEPRMYETAERFIAEFDGTTSGCLIIDSSGAEASGLELQMRVARFGVELPVIMVLAQSDVQTAVSAMRNGAATCLGKPYGDAELWTAICDAVKFADLSCEFRRRRADAQRRLRSLTLDERRVLQEVMGGKANKKIAKDLDVGLRTVELRRAMILQKMAARSLPELGQMVMLAGDNSLAPALVVHSGDFVPHMHAARGYSPTSATLG